MRVEIAASEADLHALWPAWQACWEASERCPFTAPAWMRPWWQAFGNARPHVAVLRHECVVHGVLPLYRYEDRLLPIGVGVSDRFDAIVSPAGRPQVGLLLAEALRASGCDRADFPELAPGARLLGVAAPAGWQAHGGPASPCPVLHDGTAAIPKSMRRDVRKARNRVARDGGWSATRAGEDDWEACFGTLCALHGARWRARSQTGVLADAAVLAFQRAAIPSLLAAGLLRLEILHLRGQAAAATLGLLAPGTLCIYVGGFSPAFAPESPGTLLLAHMIEAAEAEGRTTVDFLRGAEPYKYLWGASDRLNAHRSFVRA